jgi:flagellar basal-body rod modification protein FlgD
MLAQLAQFQTLSGMEQLNTSFSDMLSLQELTQGSSLIGKQISYTNSKGSISQGTVSSVAMSSGQIALQVNNDQVQLSQVIGVFAGP